MRKLVQTLTLATVMVCTAVSATAATPAEFYLSLLRRGISAHEAGRNEEAVRQLRIAAFGLIDAVEHYQTAQVYLALTYERLGNKDRVAEAVRRVAVADRGQRKFATLTLTPSVRKAFETLAARTLSDTEMAGLRAAAGTTVVPPPATAIAPPPTTKPAAAATKPPVTITQPPVVVDRVDVEVQKAPAVPQQTPNTPPKPPPQQTTTTTPRQTPPQQTTTTTPRQTPPDPAPPTQTPRETATTTPPAATTTAPQTRGAVPSPAPGIATPARPAPPQPAQPTDPRPARPTFSASEIASRLAAAERALNAANLVESRRLYRELLAADGVERGTLIRVAEGLYRARDFPGSLAAFERIGGLRRGEEPFRYYIAVSLYETGHYAQARTELATVLPFIEITPDVARYRAKIEGAVR